VIPISATR